MSLPVLDGTNLFSTMENPTALEAGVTINIDDGDDDDVVVWGPVEVDQFMDEALNKFLDSGFGQQQELKKEAKVHIISDVVIKTAEPKNLNNLLTLPPGKLSQSEKRKRSIQVEQEQQNLSLKSCEKRKRSNQTEQQQNKPSTSAAEATTSSIDIIFSQECEREAVTGAIKIRENWKTQLRLSESGVKDTLEKIGVLQEQLGMYEKNISKYKRKLDAFNSLL